VLIEAVPQQQCSQKHSRPRRSTLVNSTLMKLPAERSLGERRRVHIEIVVRGIVDNCADLVSSGRNATRSFASRSGDVLIVEEINPVRTLTTGPGDVQVESSNLARQPLPIDGETGCLLLRVEVELARALSAGIPAPGTSQGVIETEK
jgi:ribosomal protein L32